MALNLALRLHIPTSQAVITAESRHTGSGAMSLTLVAEAQVTYASRMQAQSGSIDRISSTDAAELSDLSQTTISGAAAARGAAACQAPHNPDHAANGIANGTDDAVRAQPAQTSTAKGGVPTDGKAKPQHLRRQSTGDDFEASAAPRGKDGYGDADDTRHVGAGSQYYDPRKDVVLRIECATDAQTRVCPRLTPPVAMSILRVA